MIFFKSFLFRGCNEKIRALLIRALFTAKRGFSVVAPIKVNIGLERELINEYELLIDLSYVDERYVSNDQENVEPKMPDYYLVDLYVNNNNNFYDISFGVNNLFDEAYYDFAISSVFHDDAHYGTRNVYPLPGRNFFVNLGYTF